MKVLFDESIKDLSGQEVPDSHTGKILAGLLAQQKSDFHPIKAMEIAQSIYKGNEVELSKDEVDKLKKFIEGQDNLAPIAKAVMLISLRE